MFGHRVRMFSRARQTIIALIAREVHTNTIKWKTRLEVARSKFDGLRVGYITKCFWFVVRFVVGRSNIVSARESKTPYDNPRTLSEPPRNHTVIVVVLSVIVSDRGLPVVRNSRRLESDTRNRILTCTRRNCNCFSRSRDVRENRINVASEDPLRDRVHASGKTLWRDTDTGDIRKEALSIRFRYDSWVHGHP